MRRVTSYFLAIILGAGLAVTAVAPVRALYQYETGYSLCDPQLIPPCSGPVTVSGVAATISIPNQALNPGDSIAFWTGLDEYPVGAGIPYGTHWWAQAGYVIGTVNVVGATYSTPEIYFETNGNSYRFQPIASVGWDTSHTFQVWVNALNGQADFSLDGGPPNTVAMPQNFNQGGTVGAEMEVHESSNSHDLAASGSFSNLQYYGCWIIGQSCWHAWASDRTTDTLSFYTPPYFIQIISKTSFTADGDPSGSTSCTSSPNCLTPTYISPPTGGGCSSSMTCRKYL